jgi:hypothetical protein
MYILLGGIWDGRAGFTWCMLQAFYEYLILLKVWEIRNLPTPELDPNLLAKLGQAKSVSSEPVSASILRADSSQG